MNLKTDYRNLYQHWLREFETVELTPLTQEDFEYFQKTVDYVRKYEVESKENVEIQLLKSYKKGFEYLFNDFLKIREIKLFNSALILQDINYNNMIEAEKLFFQNLVSAIKGFKKLKTIPLYDEDEPIEIEEIIETEDVSIKETPLDVPIEEIREKNVVYTKSDKLKPIETEQIVQYDYILIRFNDPSPPLVGIDGINYGPFQENDIANMPKKNAKILIYEKIAEEIDVS